MGGVIQKIITTFRFCKTFEVIVDDLVSLFWSNLSSETRGV